MIAVIKTGGKQYVVKEGDELKIEKLTAGKGEDVSLEVLLVAESDGSKVDIGAPSLDRTVTAEVVAHGRSKKVEVVKYKPKVRYKKRTGHRQEFTKIKVKNIA
ncbi:50S ribosomal protein L21 [Patescibacteria group bacterium]|nr:50S ribosomal protein L21 [Patescibacteria group bacterium]